MIDSTIDSAIRSTPWDTKIFGYNCFEITDSNEKTLMYAAKTPGHYSIKVDPLSSKALLHKYGCYYTDTLIQPYCTASRLKRFSDANISILNNPDILPLLAMCDGTFLHGRFHRDFNLSQTSADQRYQQWLTQLNEHNEVLALMVGQQTAGFIAHDHGNFLLHAMDKKFRRKGLAKYCWSAACEYLFNLGIQEITSSISASNLAALNLYASLGFRFNHAIDIYHLFTPKEARTHAE